MIGYITALLVLTSLACIHGTQVHDDVVLQRGDVLLKSGDVLLKSDVSLQKTFYMEFRIVASVFKAGKQTAVYVADGRKKIVSVKFAAGPRNQERRVIVCLPVMGANKCYKSVKSYPIGKPLTISVRQHFMRPDIPGSGISTVYINGLYARNWGHDKNPYPAWNMNIKNAAVFQGGDFTGSVSILKMYTSDRA